MKDAEEAVVPAPEVMESATVPVKEETLTPAEPEPEAENKPESVDTEPPAVEAVEADVADPKDTKLVVGHEIGSSSPSISQPRSIITQARSHRG